MDSHQAEIEPFPNCAKKLSAFSEKVIIGRDAAIAIITTTNNGSVKLRVSM